jgi:hypothetical protein
VSANGQFYASQLRHKPFRRNNLVAEAWDKIWPPMGFSAPPATNVIVAPGSAVLRRDYMTKFRWVAVFTLNLIREQYGNLDIVINLDVHIRRKDSQNIILLREFCQFREHLTRPVDDYCTIKRTEVNTCASCMEGSDKMKTFDMVMGLTFCWRSLSSPRPE